MRITWVANGVEGYGIARAATARMSQVRDAGHEVSLCAVARGSLTSQVEQLGFPTRVLGQSPAQGVPGRGLAKLANMAGAAVSTLRLRAALAEELRGLGPDVVHVIAPTLLAAGGWAARRLGAAAVWEMANSIEGRMPFGLNRRVYQAICNRYHVLPIANSRYTASTLGPTRHPAVVIYPATDVLQFDPAKVVAVPRAALGVPEESLVAVVCGRLTPSKGQAEVVQALALCRRQASPDLRIVFVGGPGSPADHEYAARLQSLAEALGVADRVVFAGPSGDVASYYAMADFSISFRIDPEPFGLSIIESMFMQKPPIVHALGGPQETVEDGVSGWHVHEPTAEALAAALISVVTSRVHLPACGITARQRATHMTSASNQLDAYIGRVSAHSMHFNRLD